MHHYIWYIYWYNLLHHWEAFNRLVYVPRIGAGLLETIRCKLMTFLPESWYVLYPIYYKITGKKTTHPFTFFSVLMFLATSYCWCFFMFLKISLISICKLYLHLAELNLNLEFEGKNGHSGTYKNLVMASGRGLNPSGDIFYWIKSD